MPVKRDLAVFADEIYYRHGFGGSLMVDRLEDELFPGCLIMNGSSFWLVFGRMNALKSRT
jgi:hypothetical protein